MRCPMMCDDMDTSAPVIVIVVYFLSFVTLMD
jgi:hypothetical protein